MVISKPAPSAPMILRSIRRLGRPKSAEHKKRHERHDVALPRQRATLPPEDYQERGRQRGSDGLGQKPQNEEAEGEVFEGPRDSSNPRYTSIALK